MARATLATVFSGMGKSDAAAFYGSRGADERVRQIETALANIDSESPIATAVSTD